MKKINFKSKKILIAIICLILICGISVLGINEYVKLSQKYDYEIISSQTAVKVDDADCILVLGCKANSDGTPSSMLRDRLERAIELYNLGVAPKIIMSGDHGQEEYDEVNVMKKYAEDAGVPSEDIFMDHAGFSTYDSIYRARDVFCAEKIIIVSQEYHLYRALYIAEKLGVEAFGVSSDYHTYKGALGCELREILARNKDFFKAIIKPEPTFLGEKIPVSGNGNQTND